MSAAPEPSSTETNSTETESHQTVAHTNECNENEHSVCADSREPDEITVDITSTDQATPECPMKQRLREWLNKNLRIEMTDGRVLFGVFLCTDRDSNIILGSCSEFLTTTGMSKGEDARLLGLVMIPGRHIVSIQIEVASV